VWDNDKGKATLNLKKRYLCIMAKRVVYSNEHLKDEKQRFDSIFHNIYVSFEIEGIKIPMDEALKIAEEVKREISAAQFQSHQLSLVS